MHAGLTAHPRGDPDRDTTTCPSGRESLHTMDEPCKRSYTREPRIENVYMSQPKRAHDDASPVTSRAAPAARRAARERTNRQASITDVARKAGVSVASVSRVMNGQTNVRDATRKRILAAVRALHYVPHSGARSLITRHTNAVGVLLPDLYGEFFSELIRGIDTVARPRGLQLLLSSVHGGASEVAEAIRAMRGRVDGLLLMSPHVDAALLDQNLPSGLPVVLLNSPLKGARAPSVNVDGYQGARAMVRHLASLGRKRIAHVAGPPNHLDSGERLRGYVDEMARVDPDATTLVVRGDFGITSGYAAGRRLASRADRPDAVFAANDAMAVGCLSAFEDAGLRVPEDIAVVGFDDIPLASLVRPALTTAAVHIADLGSRALEMLIVDMEGPSHGKVKSRSFVPEVVVRDSCGAHREPTPRRPGRPVVGGV